MKYVDNEATGDTFIGHRTFNDNKAIELAEGNASLFEPSQYAILHQYVVRNKFLLIFSSLKQFEP